MYQLAIYYRSVNDATQKNRWYNSHIGAFFTDIRGAGTFTAIYFCLGYWRLPLHEDSQLLYEFMTLDCLMQPTRTNQGGSNNEAHFQVCVDPFFREFRDKILAWMDDFAVHAKYENGLL